MACDKKSKQIQIAAVNNPGVCELNMNKACHVDRRLGWRSDWQAGDVTGDVDRQTGGRQRWEDINGEMGKPARRQPDDGVVGWGGGTDWQTRGEGRTDGRADRQLRRSTGSHTVRLRYPGNEQLISHSQITEFSSIFIVPGGQLGRANGQTLGQGDRRGDGTAGTDKQAERRWLNALLDSQHTIPLQPCRTPLWCCHNNWNPTSTSLLDVRHEFRREI